MKNIFLKFLIIFVVFAFNTNTLFAFYNDVPEDHKYYEAIESLYLKDLIPRGTNFYPDKQLTKAELYKMILEYSKIELSDEIKLPYKDIKADSEYAKYIQTAIDLNLLKPSGNNPEFTPDSLVVKNTALKTAFDTLGVGTNLLFKKKDFPFTDLGANSTIAPVAKKAAELGIFETQKDKFKSAKRITKGEAAYYLYKINQYSPTAQRIIIETKITPTSPSSTLIDNKSFKTLLNVWDSLKNEFINKDELDESKLIYGAIKGMVQETGDTYTIFQTPEEAKSFIGSLSSEFEGIGIVIELVEKNVTVVAPLKNSPAEKAGIKTKDIIVKVDNENMSGKSIDYVSSKIKGTSGSKVKITVKRDGKEKTFTVKRELITYKTVDSKMLEKNIGYISISSFNNDTYSEFTSAVLDLLDQDMKGLIIDLRNNPGGYMDTAINIIGLFTKEKKTAVKLVYNNTTQEYKTDGNGLLEGHEIVILINEGSASASEIMAGALKDYGIAKLIGEKTFGKGSVQQLKQFEDESAFKYTISKWITPKGNKIDGKGIEPDKKVKNLEKEDNQLEAAIDEF